MLDLRRDAASAHGKDLHRAAHLGPFRSLADMRVRPNQARFQMVGTSGFPKKAV
jgi:hypothetical protein